MSDFQERYAKMSAEERAAGWDAYHGLTDRVWHMYVCSDCDPDPMFRDEDDESGVEYDNKAIVILPSDIERPDHCPRCQSYLSLGDPTVVRVTVLGTTKETTPTEDK